MVDQDATQDTVIAVAFRTELQTLPTQRAVRFPSPRIDLPDAELVALACGVHEQAVSWALADATDPTDTLTDLLWTQAMEHPAIAALYAYEYARDETERRMRAEFRAMIGED